MFQLTLPFDRLLMVNMENVDVVGDKKLTYDRGRSSFKNHWPFSLLYSVAGNNFCRAFVKMNEEFFGICDCRMVFRILDNFPHMIV